MERKFIFRGNECCYYYEWVSNNEFHFSFNLLGDNDFIDADGDAYFINCQYFEDVDKELCSPWYFERWYEHESVDACDYFDDKLTEEEIESIKQFMIVLMNI